MEMREIEKFYSDAKEQDIKRWEHDLEEHKKEWSEKAKDKVKDLPLKELNFNLVSKFEELKEKQNKLEEERLGIEEIEILLKTDLSLRDVEESVKDNPEYIKIIKESQKVRLEAQLVQLKKHKYDLLTEIAQYTCFIEEIVKKIKAFKVV